MCLVYMVHCGQFNNQQSTWHMANNLQTRKGISLEKIFVLDFHGGEDV